MAFTQVVEIVAPTSAQVGDRVSVTIKIKNIWTATMHVSAVGVLDSANRFIDWLDYWIPAGITHSFSGIFTMPSESVTINAYSYYEDADGYWRSDASKSKLVSLEAVPVEYWHKIGTAVRTVVRVKEEIMAGAYTEIFEIIAPSSAVSGERVEVEASVENTHDERITVACAGKFDNIEIKPTTESLVLEPWAYYPFRFFFTMPSKSIRVHIWSYYWTGTDWYQDDYRYIDISLAAVPVEYWHKIGTAVRIVLSIKEVAPPELEYWHKIGTAVRIVIASIEPIPPEEEYWHEIGAAVRIVFLSIEPAPPEDEELEHWHEIGTAVRMVIVRPGEPTPPEDEEEEKKFPVGVALLIGGGAAVALLAATKGK